MWTAMYCANAQNVSQSWLLLEKSNSSRVEFDFANSEITILDDEITVNTSGEQYTFFFGEVNDFHFNAKSTAIKNADNATDLKIRLDETETLIVAAGEPLGNVVILSLTGQTVKQEQTDAKEIHISVANLNKGIYLVKTRNKTTKFIR
jgi:hypothetical protein